MGIECARGECRMTDTDVQSSHLALADTSHPAPEIIIDEGGSSSAIPLSPQVVIDIDPCSPRSNPGAAPQVLPNLARAALERMRDRTEDEGVDDDDDDDDSDFRPLKRKRVEECTVAASDPEEQTCSICFEAWSNSGNHRVVSLKCGHLFGQICIEKWLRSSGGEKCPQCNLKAKRSDIRPVYARTVAAVDTSERDHALRQLEEEKQLRIHAQREEAQALLQQNLARSECDRLRQEILVLREENRSLRDQLAAAMSSGSAGGTQPLARDGEGCSADRGDTEAKVDDVGRGRGMVGVTDKGSSRDLEGKYQHLKSMTISQSGNARVLAFEPQLGMVGVSKSSDISLAPGHGILKLSMRDLRSKEFVCVHPSSAVIRDMKFRPDCSALILTAATDKTAKLTNLQSNTVVQTFGLSAPGWACAWDDEESVYCYCGLQNGSVEQFDVRMPSQRLQALVGGSEGISGCPITAMSAINRDFNSRLNCGGLLLGSLGGCMFLEKSSSSFKLHPLETLPEGPCPSVSFEVSTRHCLASFRPTRRSPEGKHTVFQLHNVPTDRPLTCHPVQQFPGGPTYRLLSRSRLFLRPGSTDRLLAAYSHESSKKVHVWDCCSTKKLQELSVGGESALDILPFSLSSDHIDLLGTLTQNTLHIYQWH